MKSLPNFEQYTKKLIFSNCSAHFCSFYHFFGGKQAFFQKSDIIILNVLWYSIFMQKKYKKQLNGSKYIVIWKIERSDWSRAFGPKSQEREFSQI